MENILEGFRTSSGYINAFECSEYLSPGKITTTLTHNLGRKGSVFLEDWIGRQFALLHKTPSSRQTSTPRSWSSGPKIPFWKNAKLGDCRRLQ